MAHIRACVALPAVLCLLTSFAAEQATPTPAGQPRIRFEHLTAADGISEQYVFQILQDRRGFIWFSTTNGLNRYDGYQVVSYPDVPVRMFHTVTVPGLLYEDPQGTLWVGAEVLGKFDPGSGKITRFNPPHQTGTVPRHGTISAIHDDRNGFLWLGTTEPVLYRFDPRTGAFASYNLDAALPHANSSGIQAIEQDNTGRLWLGTTDGLVRFDPATGSFVAYPHSHAGPAFRKEYTFNGLLWDRSGKLWVHVPEGLDLFDPKTGIFERFVAASFWHMSADLKGRLWLYGGWPGLQLFDPQSGKLTPIRQFTTTPASAERDDGLGALLPDRDGNVWLNFRRSGGLDLYSPAFSRFGKFLADPDDPGSLGGGPVRGFSEDREGKIWIATGRGLEKFDPASGSFTHFHHIPGNPRSLDSNEIYSMHEDRSGTFWVGTYKGLGRFDRRNGAYKQLRGSIDSHEFTSIHGDRLGRLWVGDWRGHTYLLNPRTRVATKSDVSGGFTMHEDRAGNMWFGALPQGLRKLDAAGAVSRISLAQSAGGSGPEAIAVYSLREDGQGILWLGTQSGLFRFDPKSEKSTRYTTRDGLPENAIMCAVPDDLGNVWLSTFQSGMSRFNVKENRFYNYDSSDGLQGNLFTSGACYRARDGRLFFGGRAGFNAFYPRDVLSGLPAPPVVVTEFQIRGRRMSLFPRPDGLKLQPEQNAVSFEFAGLSYFHPRKTRYRFRLEGLEKQWTEADSAHRFARYTGIPPGRYVFRVQASADGGTWGENGASIRLALAPPWWRTPWSRAALVLAILTLILGAHQLRVKALEKREDRLRSVVDDRTRELALARDQAQAASQAKSVFLANMSHELRTPLNAILGFSNLLRGDGVSEKQRHDLDVINRSGEHLLNLINDVLDVAKIESGHQEVEIAPCNLRGLVSDVTAMMRTRAREKDLSLVSVEPPDFLKWVRTDAAKLRQVLINLLANAIKYTETGAVALRMHATAADEARHLWLTFEVHDTGIGIAPEDQARIFEAFVQVGTPSGQKGTGLGLSITRQFVELMGGTIEVESAAGAGSVFRVVLPVQTALESEVKAPAGDRGRIIGLEPGQPEYRILIVDDEPENRTLLERLLRDAGFRVQVTDNGAHGVELFRTWRPHFIWMDVRMQVMDGIEATRCIRELEGGREVKIVAVTASAFASERDLVMAAGMDDFLRKPYRWAEVFECLKLHLGVRYAVQEGVAADGDAGALQPEALAALPAELRADFEDALISLDSKRIAEVIDAISVRDAALGGLLARRAARFAYTSILDAINGSKTKSMTGSV